MRSLYACMSVPVLSLACAHAGAGEPTRYLELVNRAHDTLASVSAAPAGSDAYADLPLGEPLRGGGHSATVEIAGETCRHDLLLVFQDGRRVLYPGIDVCRHRGVRIMPLRGPSAPVEAIADRGDRADPPPPTE